MFQFVWNCLLFMLLLGALKAALSLRWPPIGEWRYDDLHPSLRYRDSSSLTKLLVNGVFFVVYPCVLLWRWYRAVEWTAWTDVERELFEQNVELGVDDEMLRQGTLRGRMIIQKEILLLSPGASGDESAHRGRYAGETVRDDSSASLSNRRSNEGTELHWDEEQPLNLSKGHEVPLTVGSDHGTTEMHHKARFCDSPAKSYDQAEAEEDLEEADREDGEKVPLIAPPAKEQRVVASSPTR